jgi:hypothetical protein
MTVFKQPPRYRTYLLTVWEERGREADSPAVWRFRLEEPRTGRRRIYVSLQEVIDVIKRDFDSESEVY